MKTKKSACNNPSVHSDHALVRLIRKLRSLSTLAALAAITAGAGLTAPARAATTLFDVDINAGSTPTYYGAAVIGATNDLWNGFDGGTAFTNVVFDSTGKSNLLATASLTCPVGSGPAASYDPNGTTAPAIPLYLMGAYAYAVGTPNQLVLTYGNLTPFNGQPFSLVVYSAGDYIGEACDTVVEGATNETTSTDRNITNGLGVCYVTFTGIVTNGTVTITVNPANDPNYSLSQYAILNGAQLEIQNPPVFVYPPLSVVIQPTNQTVATGSTTSYTGTPVGGSGNYTYQWYQNGTTVLSGQTNATLTLNNITEGQNGDTYDVEVNDGYNSATSPRASLTILPLSAQVQPPIDIVFQGSNATFSAVASSGSGIYTYQWYQNNVLLSGQTGSTLMLTGVTTNMTGYTYKVVINDGLTSVTSAPAILYASRSTEILGIDVSDHYYNGNAGSPTYEGQGVLGGVNDTNWNGITVQADGSGNPATIQVNVVTNSTGTNTTFSFNLVVANPGGGHNTSSTTGGNPDGLLDHYSYTYGGQGSYVGTFMGLDALDGSPFTLVIYPGNDAVMGVCDGMMATNTEAVRDITAGNGVAYLTFTGRIANGQLQFMATNDTANDDTYATLSGVQLQVLIPILPLSAQVEPTNVVVGQGATATFTAAPLGGSGNYAYQWYQNGTALSGQTGSSLALANVTTNMNGDVYDVVISDGITNFTSANSTLTVGLPLGTVDVQLLGDNANATSMSGAAVIGGDSDVWNIPANGGPGQTPVPMALNLVDGSTSSGLTLTCNLIYAQGGAANAVIDAPPLFTSSCFISSGSTATMTLSGFRINTVVSDLYLYSAAFESGNLVNGVGGAGGKFTVDSTTLGCTDDGTIVPYTLGDNYVHFTNLTPDSQGNLVISWTAEDVGSVSEGEGFQIQLVEVLPTIVPPTLTSSLVNGQVVVRWPAADSAFSLYTSPTLGSGAVWTKVTTPAPVADPNNATLVQVTLPAAGTAFFRLEN